MMHGQSQIDKQPGLRSEKVNVQDRPYLLWDRALGLPLLAKWRHMRINVLAYIFLKSSMRFGIVG